MTDAAAHSRQPQIAEPARRVNDLEERLDRLGAGRDGLTTVEAQRRFASVGANAIPEHRRSAFSELAAFFWGPIPWMIEVADVLSIVLRHWDDVAIVSVLLAFNAAIGFWQQHTATDAVQALKRQLALRASVRRDGIWQQIDASQLVPGDLVRLHLGDIIPADVILYDGDYLRVDQSALTGESLPTDKTRGDTAYSSSVAIQGDMTAVVAETGPRTYFGRTTGLVAEARPVSHFQQAVLAIGKYLIWMSLALITILIVVEVARGTRLLTLVQFALILTVASIPVAMPAVLSVTMAVGAVALSRMKAIVTRLESIEEMAGIDVLCTDKTGTLTQNRLALGDPVVFDSTSGDDLIFAAALASDTDLGDAIDQAVIAAVRDNSSFPRYQKVHFVPFDPVSKRASAELSANGSVLTVTKGAPQVVIALCMLDDTTAARAANEIQRLATTGYRTLGVARRENDNPWQFLGLLPLSDPPREDSAETLRRAEEHGISIKMLTGDNIAIAREIARQIGLGTDIERASELFGAKPRQQLDATTIDRIETVDGFAEVFPEHKYAIVKTLQANQHLVGMTGDGVNDAPALKQADTGVAVSGATDAARAAADLVLTAPGLSVIVAAIEHARQIFERMNSYAIYRITETIRIVLFVVAAMLVFDFYPITALLIILLALINDLPIMAISVDHTWIDPKPVRWQMPRVLSVATVLGTIGVIETFIMLILAKYWLHLSVDRIESLIFLKLAIAGHLTLFVARSRGPFLKRPWPAPVLLWSALGTKLLATALVAFGFGLVTRISWLDIGFVWIYALAWVFIEDWTKLAVYRRLDRSSVPRVFAHLGGRAGKGHGSDPTQKTDLTGSLHGPTTVGEST